MITLRPATLDTVRPLRLRALREDPDAFGSTLESERCRPDADWRFWVDDTLIAFDDDTPIGMANLKLGEPAEIFGMWVALRRGERASVRRWSGRCSTAPAIAR
jgi:hypothetical protein